MDSTWIESTDAYLDALEGAVDELQAALDAFSTLTSQGAFSSLAAPVAATAQVVGRLETLLDERSALLAAASPTEKRPTSLRAALRKLGDLPRVERADRIARRIELQRQHALTQFVTQYQLAEMEGRLLRILSHSGPDPGTYGPRRPRCGGGLLDGAA